MEQPDLWAIETERFAQGIQTICGVDEAGAGPLAGRVYAGAVILPKGWTHPWLGDSKKVTEKRREVLYDLIRDEAVAWSIAWAEAEEIDALNILNARMLAMNRAIEGLNQKPDLCLIDGNRDHGRGGGVTTPHRCIVKGDSLSASIAAASILAKVSRDHFMLEMAKEYPQYAFERHKGYGTKLHYERLREYGPSPIHRRSFLKNL